MMEKCIEAFVLESLFDAPGLTSLAPWGDALLAGTELGGLLIARKAKPSNPDRPASATWSLSRHYRNFGTGAVRQLETLQARSMLLSLDADGVNAYSMPSFSLKAQAARTSKSQCFAWDDQNSILCCATRKKLAFFKYDGLEFVPEKEVHLPGQARDISIIWPTVYVGLARDYVMVDIPTWNVSSLFVAGKDALPCTARISPSEVLLVREGVGVFLSAEGRVSRRQSKIPWSGAPLSLSLSQPYAVATYEGGFEVRPLEPLSSASLVQTLESESIKMISATSTGDGTLFFLREAKNEGNTLGLFSLSPLPFAEQANRLLRDGEYEEALAVASLASADDPNVMQLKDTIHAKYGRALFRRGDYNDALLHFSMGKDSGPLQLLLLLPSLAPSSLMVQVSQSSQQTVSPEDEPTGDDFLRAVATILPYLLSARSRLATAAAVKVGDASTAFDPSGSNPLAVLLDMAVLKALLIMPDSGALIQFIQRPNCIDLELGEDALRESGRYSELVCLYQSRNKHAEALKLLENLSQHPESLPVAPQGAAVELKGYPGVWAAVKYITVLGPSDAHLITAHARWILKVDPDAGLEMFTAPGTYLTPEVVLPILASHSKDLAGPYLESALASGKARADVYEQQLAMLYLRQADGDSSTTSKDVSVEEKLRNLVLSSRYLDYEALLELLPKDRLLKLRIALLERLGRHLDALHVFIHTLNRFDEAEAYCDRVYSKQQEQLRLQQQQLSGQRDQKDKANSTALPEHPVRLSWMTDVREQLSVDQRFNIYLLLIQALLDEKDNSGDGFHVVNRGPDDGRWAEIAQLLSRKRNVIHPLQALELLPGEIPLHRALPFLEGAVLGMQERTRATALQRSLISAEHMKLHGEALGLEMRCVRITPERGCSICYKRIGTTAFVAFPSGLLAHYSCFRRMAKSEAQGQ